MYWLLAHLPALCYREREKNGGRERFAIILEDISRSLPESLEEESFVSVRSNLMGMTLQLSEMQRSSVPFVQKAWDPVEV